MRPDRAACADCTGGRRFPEPGRGGRSRAGAFPVSSRVATEIRERCPMSARFSSFDRAVAALPEILEARSIGANANQISLWFHLPITVTVKLLRDVDSGRAPRPPQLPRKVPTPDRIEVVFGCSPFTPQSACCHGEIEVGSWAYCPICHRSGFDGHPALRLTAEQRAQLDRSRRLEAYLARRRVERGKGLAGGMGRSPRGWETRPAGPPRRRRPAGFSFRGARAG